MGETERVQRLLERHLGLSIPPGVKLDEVTRFVGERARALGLSGPEEYLVHLSRLAPTEGELTDLVRLSTSRHSYFYRDSSQLEGICDELAQTRRRRRTTLRVWIAGCSTGEEPYTLAILCAERNVDVHFTATDIDELALQEASRGRYLDLQLRKLPPEMRARWFTREEDEYRLLPAIRGRVDFLHHNVLSRTSPVSQVGAWDAIVCRNVFIYYEQSVVDGVVRWLTRQLTPGGWLFCGPSDLIGTQPRAELVRRSVGGGSALRLPGDTPRPAMRVVPRPPAAPAAPATPAVPDLTPPPPPRPLRRGSEDLYASAMTQVDRGDRAAARELLRALLHEQPRHVVALLSLGNLHLADHELDQAQASYSVAEELAPNLAEVHFLAGVLLKKRRSPEAASRSLRRALFLEPSFWQAAFLLGGLWQRLGRLDRAAAMRQLTLRLLDEGAEPALRSRVVGLPGLELEADEVRTHCRTLLVGAATGPRR